MKYLLYTVLLLILSTGCRNNDYLLERTKRVRFKKKNPGNFYSPELTKKLDSNFQASFIIRRSFEPESEVVSEVHDYSNSLIQELENQFVKNGLTVIDRPLYYYSTRQSDSTNHIKVDYYIELTNIIETKFITGIVFDDNRYHFLTGKQITVKLVDANSGEIVGLFYAEIVPCVSGCIIKYNQIRIESIEERNTKDSKSMHLVEYENFKNKELAFKIVLAILNKIRE